MLSCFEMFITNVRLFQKNLILVSLLDRAGRSRNIVDVVVIFLGDHAVHTDDTPFLRHNYVSLLILWVDDVEDLMN